MTNRRRRAGARHLHGGLAASARRRRRALAILAAAALAGAPASPAAAQDPKPPAPKPAPALREDAAVVTYAERFIGVPYQWGANGPRRFDCSGFTSFVYRHFGYRLPRTGRQQMRIGRRVTGPLRLGDLVFWEGGGHVGIYTGRDTFVSATVHRGIWVYSFAVWRRTQPYTTARRLVGAVPLAAASRP